MNEYKTKVIRKYLTEDYGRRDTPAFIRYEHIGTKDNLLKLLDEFHEDAPFLSATLIDDILDKIDGIMASLEDKELLQHCIFFYDEIWEHRNNKYQNLVHDDWAGDVLYSLLYELDIEPSKD